MSSRVVFVVTVGVISLLRTSSLQAESYELTEPSNDSRVYVLDQKLEVDGELQTALREGKALSLKLDVAGNFRYHERRMVGRGRDAQALRSLRHYETANAKITVQKQTSSLRLRDSQRTLVAIGERDGVVLYHPKSPILASEAELLNVPGDSLSVQGLLPLTPVEVGDTWTPETWVPQMLAGVEAMVKGSVVCELKSVKNDIATVKFTGSLEGAHAGASSEIELEGDLKYNVKTRYVSQLTLTQKETRSVGPVSPGMKVTAKVTWTRTPLTSQASLTDQLVESIALNPAPEKLRYLMQTNWHANFLYGRNWHVFKQTGRVAVVRLVENGTLIAQFNVSGIPAVAPGQHTPAAQFEADIRTALGGTLSKLVEAKEVKLSGGRYAYRVVAEGTSNKLPMRWIYYLCAGPDGKQLSFVFAVEQNLVKRLADRDLKIIQSIQYTGSQTPRTSSAPRERQ